MPCARHSVAMAGSASPRINPVHAIASSTTADDRTSRNHPSWRQLAQQPRQLPLADTSLILKKNETSTSCVRHDDIGRYGDRVARN
jgi:hypothetical protein